MHRLVVVPRWSGKPDSDFYPWLTRTLADEPRFAEVVVCDLPEPGTPRLSTWPPGVRAALGEDRELLARTLVLGHSVGCQAALHALAAIPVTRTALPEPPAVTRAPDPPPDTKS